jgi:hypothetical protein
MPNWVYNNLQFKGEDKDKIKELLQGMKDGEPTAFDFNKIIPMPKAYKGTVSPNRRPEPDKPPYSFENPKMTYEEALERYNKQLALEKEYGYEDWYSWQIGEWGVKWGACDVNFSVEGDFYVYRFNTAWAEPQLILEKLSAMFPTTEFLYEAEEESRAFFYEAVYLNGERTDYADLVGYPEQDSEEEVETGNPNYAPALKIKK